MHSVLERCTPLTPVCNYGGWPNFRRCYDLVQLPAGLLVIGDAVQGLNPVYGQGMTVAAQSALLLRNQMAKALHGTATLDEKHRRLAAFSGRAFQAALAAEVLEPAWAVAAGTDLRHATTTASGPGAVRPPPSVTATLDCLARTAQRDAPIYALLMAVAHLLRPARTLLVPRVLLLLAWQAVKEAMGRAKARLGSATKDKEEAAGLALHGAPQAA